jgi:hypothetical protein
MISRSLILMVPRGGFEPPTRGFSVPEVLFYINALACVTLSRVCTGNNALARFCLATRARTADLPCQPICDTSHVMSDAMKPSRRTFQFSMRIEPELRDTIQAFAKADNRTFTNYIEAVLKDHVAKKRIDKHGDDSI